MKKFARLSAAKNNAQFSQKQSEQFHSYRMQRIGSWNLVVSMLHTWWPRMQDFKQAIQFWKHLQLGRTPLVPRFRCLQQRIGAFTLEWKGSIAFDWTSFVYLQCDSIQFNSTQFNQIHLKRASIKCFSRVQSIGGSVCSRSSEHFSTVPVCRRSVQVVALFLFGEQPAVVLRGLVNLVLRWGAVGHRRRGDMPNISF